MCNYAYYLTLSDVVVFVTNDMLSDQPSTLKYILRQVLEFLPYRFWPHKSREIGSAP